MKHLLYIIGQPGSGKSTLAAALTAGLEPLFVESKPFAHIVWAPGAVELGARRGSFSGTDALSMSVQPRVTGWLQEQAPEFILGEGDRLANGKFFTAARAAGYQLRVARIIVSAAVVDHRRATRAAELGAKPQNPTWLKGRVSKVTRLAEEWAPFVLELNGDQPVDRVLEELLASGDPVATLLASAPRA